MTDLRSDADPLFLSFQLALAGRYSIDHELGRGGMGIVYLAREVHLDRLVAIKLLPPEKASDPAVRERFLREARNAAKLSHPNIIPIHAVDETDGFVYYVMTYVNGETLSQRVRTRGPLTTSDATRVFREVAWALSHAHANGLIHRDIKPDNILLEYTTGRVLVSDFGIASAVHDQSSAEITGTPEFMSPEQALGKELDARSDLYALGVTAYYAVSGKLPFEGKNATEVLARHVTQPAPAVATLGLPVGRKLGLLIDRCLGKEPGQRPASADALAEQLSVALEQKREFPAALRAFVKRSSRINRGAPLVPLAVTLLGTPIVAFLGSETGTLNGMLSGVAWLVGGNLAAGFGYLVHSARRLLRLGFTHSDVVPAYAAEIEQAREEGIAELGLGVSRFEKTLRTVARASFITMGASILCAVLGIAEMTMVRIFTLALMLAPVSGTVYLTFVERRRDLDAEFWAKVWSGRIGKAAFWLAKKLLGKKAPVVGGTHRATELALGLASESLFEQLPAAMRRELADVPDLVRRLQHDAQLLRKQYDELQESLASAGDEAAGADYTPVREERDRVHEKLGDAVRALETIRLNLLRLHAGSGTIASFTTHIDAAAAVSAEMEQLLAGSREVHRLLHYPRDVATTPA